MSKFLSWIALSFLLLGCGLWNPAALAADGRTSADNPKVFASVWRLQGEVLAGSADGGASRKLREGHNVMVGEKVRASANGEAVLKTRDGGLIAVRPGAEFVAEAFAAEGKPSDRQILRLLTGSLRLISGWIGKLNREGHQVITPQATIGIRGTDHEPYVLSAEQAAASNNREGTYDKVNRGGTTLQANGHPLDIDAGKVGFARAANPVRTRALMTILLPVLLDKVPDFYVPGKFDAELDRYAKTTDGAAPPAAAKAAPAEPTASVASPLPPGCSPKLIGESWLDSFDRAIAQRDARTVIGLFASEAVAKANVRNLDNSLSSVELNRDELVQSTLAALQGLSDYKQRRLSVDARLADGESEASCRRIDVRSVSIEQGLQAGKPYRFEAQEEYWLELRDGRWLAVRAESTQR